VLTAYNEQKYVARTLASIWETTRGANLKEILLIDDASSPPMSDYVKQAPHQAPVVVVRHDRRQGLVRSKAQGGLLARGDVVIFLDCHVRPLENWLAPLLEHIGQNYRRVVVPVIPMLDGETWKVDETRMGIKMMFDWGLKFRWFEDGNDVVPVMSGGLLAISRRWFVESGGYDTGMRMWGSENIEQSIRTWLCGGEIMVARNSRVAHVFRSSFPYSINNTELYINKLRTVELWFDEHKKDYYAADTSASRFLSRIGSLDSRRELQSRLKCKPFSWYFHKFRGLFPVESFLLRLRGGDQCLSATRQKVRLEHCSADRKVQRFAWIPRDDGGTNLQAMGPLTCMALSEATSRGVARQCSEDGSLEWNLEKSGSFRLMNGPAQSQLCFFADSATELTVAPCRRSSLRRGGAALAFEVHAQKSMNPISS